VKDTDIIAAIAPDAVSLMDKAIAEIKRLRQENATLTAERDEARREVLLWMKERCSWIELAKEIKQRGWEYLKEDDK
jgi:hypothetical protein